MSCDEFLLSKDYEISYYNGKKDTITAVSANREGIFIYFKGKDGTTVGLYNIENLKNYKVIKYNEKYK